MSTMTLTREQSPDTGDDDEIVHAVCCNEDEALCGEKLRGIECSIDDDPLCVTCDIILSGALGWTCPYCDAIASDGYLYESE